jgi:5-methylcytosine-specific restriction endonuclease McrA
MPLMSLESKNDQIVRLLYAYPHPRFGGGRIHLFKDDLDDDGRERTLCGKTLEMCPGEIVRNVLSKVPCKVCNHAFESAAKWAEESARWQREAEERERERAEESRRWRSAYEKYLQTPTWLEKRRLVMRRARSLCEGCGVLNAIQVHHLSYPRGVVPGSPEWIKAEKLFDLVALCRSCHEDMHPPEPDNPSAEKQTYEANNPSP